MSEIVLLSYIVVSHAVFLFCIHKLINKLMSRDYYDYRKEPPPLKDKMKPERPIEMPDIGHLDGIG